MRRLGIDVSEHNGILELGCDNKKGRDRKLPSSVPAGDILKKISSFEGMYGNVSVSKCPMDSIIIPMLPMMHR